MQMAYNFKSEDVCSKTNQIFKNIRLKGDSFAKFKSIIELHSNSLSNATTENQIVNLWTMFETLVPRNHKKI